MRICLARSVAIRLPSFIGFEISLSFYGNRELSWRLVKATRTNFSSVRHLASISVRFPRYSDLPATRIFLIVVGTLTLRSNKSVFPSQTTYMTAGVMLLSPMRYHQPVYSGEDSGWNSGQREGWERKKESWAHKNLECFSSSYYINYRSLAKSCFRVISFYRTILIK